MAVPVALAQRQTPGEDWVVVGMGDQEEAADDEQQQKVRLGVLEAIYDDQRPVRWEGCVGGGWTRQLITRGRCVLWGEVRQWELESARREGEGEGAQQQ